MLAERVCYHSGQVMSRLCVDVVTVEVAHNSVVNFLTRIFSVQPTFTTELPATMAVVEIPVVLSKRD